MRAVWLKKRVVVAVLLVATSHAFAGGLAGLPRHLAPVSRGDEPGGPPATTVESGTPGGHLVQTPAGGAAPLPGVRPRPSLNPFEAVGPYAGIIERAAASQGVDPNLVRAIIQVESRFHAEARSPQGAMGLMQLSPDVVRHYSVRDPFDPQANIEGGIKYLKRLLGHFDLIVALAAYNAGEAAVDRFQGIPPYPETQSFIHQVLVEMGKPASR